MSLLKRAGDLVYTFRFLALLVTKFEDTEAFKAGIIDADGNRNKRYDTSTFDKREALANYYTPFHRLVFNIKKLIAKVPGGSSTIASYAAALYLIKEKYGVPEAFIVRGLKEVGITQEHFVVEQMGWFVAEDGRLSQGPYKLRNPKMITSTLDELAQPRDAVKAGHTCFPVGQVLGVNIYEVTHSRTNQPIYVTIEDLVI